METLLLITIVIVFAFVLIRAALNAYNFNPSRKSILIVGIIWVLSMALFASTIILAEKNIYYRGYRSSSFIFLFMGLCGFVFCLFVKRNELKIISSIIAFIQLFLSGILLLEMIVDYKSQLYYDDKKYRIEDVSRGIMRAGAHLNLFVKEDIIEHQYEIFDNYPNGINLKKSETDSIKIIELRNDSLEIIFYHHLKDTSVQNPFVKKHFTKNYSSK